MIFIGCIGVAVFVNSLSISKTKSNLAGFMAAVFYFLSLVSVQQFYVPLEMFAVHYAVVPWVMYCLYNLMVFGDRKWTLWFVLLSIFTAATWLVQQSNQILDINIVYLNEIH
jgi:hypothetical protein